MKEYHKIQTVYERDPATNLKKVIIGKFALPVFEYLAEITFFFLDISPPRESQRIPSVLQSFDEFSSTHNTLPLSYNVI